MIDGLIAPHGGELILNRAGEVERAEWQARAKSLPQCLDHILILHEKQLHRVLRCYVAYFNRARPHQGIQQQIPELLASSSPQQNQREKVIAIPLLGGLHHDYRKVA